MMHIRQLIAIILVVSILLFSIFLAYIVFIDPPTGSDSIDAFEPEICKDANPISICKSPAACCTNTNYDYFCKHPLTKLCSQEQKACLDAPLLANIYPIELRKQKCADQQSICCTTFDKIADAPNAFENIGDVTQNTNIIGNYLALATNDREKCKKMCQTDTECAAVKISPAGCQFYSAVDPIKSRLASLAPASTSASIGYFKKL
jgi:hypothetical protein